MIAYLCNTGVIYPGDGSKIWRMIKLMCHLRLPVAAMSRSMKEKRFHTGIMSERLKENLNIERTPHIDSFSR
ncbi:MAG: hypothetical protein WCD89_07005 [Anaerocolumna sp.]